MCYQILQSIVYGPHMVGELQVYPRPFHNCSGESLFMFLKLRRKELSWLLLSLSTLCDSWRLKHYMFINDIL